MDPCVSIQPQKKRGILLPKPLNFTKVKSISKKRRRITSRGEEAALGGKSSLLEEKIEPKEEAI